MIERYVYRPLPAALLTCKAAPTEAAGTDDLDVAGLYNRAVDAWLDCWSRIRCVAALQAEKPCEPSLLRREGP